MVKGWVLLMRAVLIRRRWLLLIWTTFLLRIRAWTAVVRLLVVVVGRVRCLTIGVIVMSVDVVIVVI